MGFGINMKTITMESLASGTWRSSKVMSSSATASTTRVFNDLCYSGATLSPMIYNCYLKLACSAMIALSAGSFQKMKALEHMDVVGYNISLRAYLAKVRTQEAHALVKEMAPRGLQVNNITYKCQGARQARRRLCILVDEMSAVDVRANYVTPTSYSELITSFISTLKI